MRSYSQLVYLIASVIVSTQSSLGQVHKNETAAKGAAGVSQGLESCRNNYLPNSVGKYQECLLRLQQRYPSKLDLTLALVRAHLWQNELIEAEQLIASLPAELPDALILRGDFYWQKNEKAQSIAAYEQAIKIAADGWTFEIDTARLVIERLLLENRTGNLTKRALLQLRSLDDSKDVYHELARKLKARQREHKSPRSPIMWQIYTSAEFINRSLSYRQRSILTGFAWRSDRSAVGFEYQSLARLYSQGPRLHDAAYAAFGQSHLRHDVGVRLRYAVGADQTILYNISYLVDLFYDVSKQWSYGLEVDHRLYQDEGVWLINPYFTMRHHNIELLIKSFFTEESLRTSSIWGRFQYELDKFFASLSLTYGTQDATRHILESDKKTSFARYGIGGGFKLQICRFDAGYELATGAYRDETMMRGGIVCLI